MKRFRFKSLIAFGVILLVWSMVTLATDWVKPIFIPSPLDIVESLIDMKDTIIRATLTSLFITLSGFLTGTLIGICLGLLIAYSRNFMEIVGPALDFTRPVPVFALIPLFIVWFGIGFTPQILLVALGVSVVLGVSTYEAVRNLPVIYVRAALNLGATKNDVFKTIVIPYIFPHLIGAIRVGAALSWGLDVAAEFMGSQIGLGYQMVIQQIYLSTSGIVTIVIIYGVFAILFDQLIRAVEARLTHWTERSLLSLYRI